MTEKSPFFTVHSGLPREGPGLPGDVHWALELAGTPHDAVICDAACGPGADIVTLAQARPDARIDAFDLQDHFIAAAKERTAEFGTRITAEVRDYTDLPRDYDLIWCAGAAYFVGFLNALALWKPRLKPGGAVAFSEPVFAKTPPSKEVTDFWEGVESVLSVSQTKEVLEAAGWQVLGHREIIGAPWAAYYDPMRARLEMLKAGQPDAALQNALAEADEEILRWEAATDEVAYGLFVVRPL